MKTQITSSQNVEYTLQDIPVGVLYSYDLSDHPERSYVVMLNTNRERVIVDFYANQVRKINPFDDSICYPIKDKKVVLFSEDY